MPTKYTEAASEILPGNLRSDPSGSYLYDDSAALKLVLDATSDGDAWANQQNWPAGWSFSYEAYQSPTTLSCFDGGGNGSANVPNYTVSNLVDSTVPKVMGGLFYETPPFLLRPRPGTTQDMVEAKTSLFAYQLEDMGFEDEMELAITQDALIGTMIMKWGWTDTTVTTKKYKRRAQPQKKQGKEKVHTIHTEESDAFDIVFEEQRVTRPWIKYCDRRHVIVNRGCRVGDIRKAKDVVYRDYATYEDLDNLRDYEGYTIPSEDELRDFFMRARFTPEGDPISVTLPESMRGWIQTSAPRNAKDSADPLQNGLELLEYWSKNMVIVVLRHGDDNILIRNEANPYKKIPFLSACWRPIPDCFDGQGIGLLAGPAQLVQAGITNASLSLLDYGLDPIALRTAGFNTPSQDIVWSQGGILDVEGDVTKAFKFLEMPEQPQSAMQWLQQQAAEAKENAGANANFSMGASLPGIQTTGARSGTGAANVGAAVASRLDGPISRIVRQVFIPWLQIMDELNNDRLPASVLRDVLSKEMGQQIDIDHEQFRNAEIEYEVLAGAKLGPKKEMAQFFTFVVQLLNNPTFMEMIADQGNTLDASKIFKMFAASAGWKYSQDFLVPMSDEQKQRHAANSPAAVQAAKAKAAQEAQAAKFQQETQLEQEKQLAKAGGEVYRSTIEHSMDADQSGLASPFSGGSTI
jgi:hypothetical protein